MARPLLTGCTMGTMATKATKRSAARGFTLVELAIVVVIVGVLSVIAVVGYRKITLSSKMTEAQNLIAAIRIAQEDYKAERGTYANIGANYCPLTTSGTLQVKTQWNSSCNGGTASWSLLPVHTDGPVQFGYRTAAGATAFADPFAISWMNFGGMPTDRPWYLIHARADLDNDSSSGPTELCGTSQSGQIFTHNEGL